MNEDVQDSIERAERVAEFYTKHGRIEFGHILADVLHLAESKGVDVERLIEDALINWNAEREGEQAVTLNPEGHA